MRLKPFRELKKRVLSNPFQHLFRKALPKKLSEKIGHLSMVRAHNPQRPELSLSGDVEAFLPVALTRPLLCFGQILVPNGETFTEVGNSLMFLNNMPHTYEFCIDT